MTATFSLRPPPPFLRYLLETRKPRKSALGRDRGADCRWMGGRRRLKPVLTTHKWMRLATFRARVTTDVTTGKSIYCASSVCSVPHLTFHICVHSKNTGERVLPEATGVCLPCLSVGSFEIGTHLFVSTSLLGFSCTYLPASPGPRSIAPSSSPFLSQALPPRLAN